MQHRWANLNQPPEQKLAANRNIARFDFPKIASLLVFRSAEVVARRKPRRKPIHPP